MDAFSPSLLAFYLLAACVVGLALLAVTSANLVRAALALAFGFFAVAGVFWLLGSPFLAVLQLVINAGAIPIVTIFIVMMTQSRVSYLRGPMAAVWALLLAVPLAVVLVVSLQWGPVNRAAAGSAPPSTVTPLGVEELGVELLSQRGNEVTLSSGETLRVRGGGILAFEVTALILLVAFVGAVILARREDPTFGTRRHRETRGVADVDA